MTRQNAPKPAKKGGPNARADAMRMLADGFRIGAVARELGINRCTLRDWRDSPEGQRLLDAARKTREAQIAESRDAALRILQEGAVLAAQRLVDRAASAVPFEAINASEAILARVGLPRSTKVEATVGPGLDLSALSDDELATLEALHAKARG